ncbi:DUF5617 domain-containing protein [Legionella sp. WA2022007384]
MPKVVLYDVDGTLISQASLGENNRKLFFPSQTAHVFKEHLRKNDHIIVCSAQSSADEIRSALQGANIDITKIEILGKAETSILVGDSSSEKKVNKAKAAMNRKLNTAVIVEDSLNINADDEDIIHILVPTNAPENIPASDSYLKAALLPASTLRERVHFQVEAIKYNALYRTKGVIDVTFVSNLYQRVLNLFTVPNSYHNLCLSQTNTPMTNYEIGISFLADYCKNQPSHHWLIGSVHRFFTGHWDRHHTEVVEKLLKDHAGNLDGKNKKTIESLLSDLETKLLEAGNHIKPEGSLGRRIEFIQSKAGVSIIDIDDLNHAIDLKQSELRLQNSN